MIALYQSLSDPTSKVFKLNQLVDKGIEKMLKELSEPEELKYIINPKTNKCFKLNIDLKTKIINDIEDGTITYSKTTYRFGTIIELSHSGSTEPIIIYTWFGVCRVAEDIIEYGEPKFNIDYYNNLNK